MAYESSSYIFPALVFLFGGFLCLLVSIYYHKKGKILVYPWGKTLFGRRASWSLEYVKRDNLEDWALFWHYLIAGYAMSIIFISIGFIILLISIEVIQLP